MKQKTAELTRRELPDLPTGHRPAPLLGSALRVTLLAALALSALAFSLCATALAGTYVINNCPAAAGSSDAGPLAVFGGSQAAKASCGGGEGDWIGPRGASMSPGALDGVQVISPSGITIRQAKVWWYVPHQSSGADTFALAATNGGLLSESQTPLEQRGTPSVFTLPSGSTVLTLADYCSNSDAGQGCSFGGTGSAHLALFGSELTLEENQPPSGSVTGGGLTSSQALSAAQSLSFNASDAQSGVRVSQLRVDGTIVAQSDYGPSCSYTNFVACPQTESGAITWNTAAVPDGHHGIELLAIDAAQNSAVIYSGAITTKNAPSSTSLPSIEGAKQPLLGSALSGTPGTWSAPSAAGPLTYGFQWEQCDTQGQSCAPIPGATGQTYTPVASDLGHTLRLLVSASDNDGLTQAASMASAVVEAKSEGPPPGPASGPSPSTLPSSGVQSPSTGPAPISATQAGAELQLNTPARLRRAFAHRAFTLSGRLLSPNGAPIAGAILDVLQRPLIGSLRSVGQVVSGADGSFAAAIPPGPSRIVEVGYRPSPSDPSYTAQAGVLETVTAGVKLTITTISPGSILLSGRVAGPVPRHGVIVDLLVHYRGSWVPFRTPRSDAAGHFVASYHFQGSTGRFPFQAEVPGEQADFSFDRGLSSVINVTAG